MMPTPRSIRLAFAGGGTGGHFYPAVAIADRVREMLEDKCLVRIEFVGTVRGIEYRRRDSLRYPLHLINIRGLVRSLSLKNLMVPFLMVSALLKSRAILKELSPDIVVGTGGYVSWPVLRMASFMNIPTVLQEQNSFPGMTTRQLASRAARIYLGFDAAKKFLPSGATTMTTGNPVRTSIVAKATEDARQRFGLDQSSRTILVLGGSQGARSINQAVLKSLKAGSLPDGYQLLWQTGKLDYDDLAAAVASLGEMGQRLSLFAFENRIDLVLKAADLAIARAGAITLAELEATCLPSLLIPYPFAAGDHQRQNAQASADLDMAVVVDPDDLEATDIISRAVTMFESDRVTSMKEKMQQQLAGRKPAVDIIAEDIIRLVAKAQEVTIDRRATSRT